MIARDMVEVHRVKPLCYSRTLTKEKVEGSYAPEGEWGGIVNAGGGSSKWCVGSVCWGCGTRGGHRSSTDPMMGISNKIIIQSGRGGDEGCRGSSCDRAMASRGQRNIRGCGGLASHAPSRRPKISMTIQELVQYVIARLESLDKV